MTLRLRTISLRAKTVKTLHTFAIHSIASGLSYFFPAEVKEGQAGGKGYASTERTATRTGRIFAGAAGSACAMQWVEVEEACVQLRYFPYMLYNSGTPYSYGPRAALPRLGAPVLAVQLM